ncbi:MAG: aminotransferase class I/II-fold pyridoxal phosphate-dependent enzyme, partial [Gemmatimonadales bacterium]
GYPAYAGGAILADARLETVSLESRNGFLLEMSDLPLDRLECARLVFLNYPNNPTAAVAPLDFLQRTVGLCKSHRIALAYDNPYCEITYDGYVAPSVLEVSGARDVTVEFHSLSKSACMTGWRLGWAVGSAELIALLSKVKSYVDAGPFLAVQQAGAKVLDSLESVVQPVRTCLAKRRDAAVEAFDRAGFKVDRPKAGMYLWLRVPARVPSSSFARDVLEHEGVAIMPGSAFGESCDEYVRIALTVAPERLIEAAERLGRALAGLEAAGASA